MLTSAYLTHVKIMASVLKGDNLVTSLALVKVATRECFAVLVSKMSKMRLFCVLCHTKEYFTHTTATSIMEAGNGTLEPGNPGPLAGKAVGRPSYIPQWRKPARDRLELTVTEYLIGSINNWS